MHVTVEYNASSYSYFFAPVFVHFPSLEQSLLDDFRAYKATGKLPDYFGRDTGYDRPPDIKDAELMHLHLQLGPNIFTAPPKNANLTDPKTVQWHRTSNSALVYSQNLIDENRYSLIALFHPVAHMSANNDQRMRVLAQYSRDFRSSFIL